MKKNDIIDQIAAHLAWCEELALMYDDPSWEPEHNFDEMLITAIRRGEFCDNSSVKEDPHHGDCVSVPMTCERCLCEDWRKTAKKWMENFGVKVDWEPVPVTPENSGGRHPKRTARPE